MSKMRVTIVQATDASHEPRLKLERMMKDVGAHASSDLIVFPELAMHGHWVSGGSPSDIQLALDAIGEDGIAEFHQTIADNSTSVVYGKLALRDGKLYNLATFTDGRTSVDYAKTHVHWSEVFEPGREFPVVRSFPVPIGMLICFDAAFPEVGRILALNGAQMIVNISAIPPSFSLEHVHRRLVACSAQNQLFTVFANRAGNGFLGGSAVVDPQGQMLAVAGTDPTLTVDIDLSLVQRWREEEPHFLHRRPDIYGALVAPGLADTPK